MDAQGARAGPQDLWTLKDLAETVFRRRLEQIDGVAQAAIAGGLDREIHVDVDAQRLEALGLALDDVIAALDAANRSAPGGTILRGRYRYSLRTLGEFQAVDEIRDVVLNPATQDSNPSGVITLADVATIDDGFKERESIAKYGGREAVGLLVFKESGANTVRVAEEVSAVLERLGAEYPEVRFDVATSQAGFIADSISNVVQALVFGGVLAFLVLFLFLRDWRYPVAIALAIPISVIGTFILLDFTNVSLNIMSLGGLALGVGMLVDNSIVVLENIFRHRQAGVGATEASARGADEVRGAITASTLTTISVFGPIIYVEGVAGQLFRSLSLAVAFSLLASLLVALTLLPMLAARWQRTERAPGRRLAVLGGLLEQFDRSFSAFGAWYHRLLSAALDHRGRVLAIALTLLGGTTWLGVTLERGVLPDVEQGAFTVRIDLPPGTPLEGTLEVAGTLEATLLGDPGVSAVFARVGRQETLAGIEEEQTGFHTAILDVRLEPGASSADVVPTLLRASQTVPAGAMTIETGSLTALGRLLGGSEADLAIRVRSDDLDDATAYARELQREMVNDSTFANIRLGTEEGQPEILVQIDRDRAAAFDVDPATIAEAIEGYMRGTVATEFVDFDRKIPIVVRLPDADRRALGTLDRLTVAGIPLRELVHPQETVSPAEIHRLDQARTIMLYADRGEEGLDQAVRRVESIMTSLPPPPGVRTEIGGDTEERARSFRDLAFAFGLAILLVYMILAAQFESFLHPFTILLAVPLAAIGAVLALWVTTAGLNTMSLIGIVVLVGIVVNDAIVKVDFINQLRRSGLALRDAILEAGRVRLRPILMTTVTTVLGLTPMALGIGRGADLRAPLAIAVIGGLLSATMLTLIVVPVAYDLIEEIRQALRRWLRFGPSSSQEIRQA